MCTYNENKHYLDVNYIYVQQSQTLKWQSFLCVFEPWVAGYRLNPKIDQYVLISCRDFASFKSKKIYFEVYLSKFAKTHLQCKRELIIFFLQSFRTWVFTFCKCHVTNHFVNENPPCHVVFGRTVFQTIGSFNIVPIIVTKIMMHCFYVRNMKSKKVGKYNF